MTDCSQKDNSASKIQLILCFTHMVIDDLCNELFRAARSSSNFRWRFHDVHSAKMSVVTDTIFLLNAFFESLACSFSLLPVLLFDDFKYHCTCDALPFLLLQDYFLCINILSTTILPGFWCLFCDLHSKQHPQRLESFAFWTTWSWLPMPF